MTESPFAKVVKSRDVISLEGLINERKKSSKWRDICLRKALNYAVNREELWKYAAKGNALNLGGHIPVGACGYNPELVLYTYDTDKARALLKEAGYPDGFDVEMITIEPLKLEAQIISKMLERVGLRVKLHVLTRTEDWKKTYIPILDKPPEEKDWDIALRYSPDIYGHTGATVLAFGLIEQSDFRWIEYDSVYEEMWTEMSRTLDKKAQEEKMRQMMKYIYEQAHMLFVYNPISLYAVNKEVDFIPQKFALLRLKETSVTDNHWSVRNQE